MPIENPFQDPLRFERRVPECAVVIFGANGDLTKRKLLPALYRLAYDRRLSAGFAVVGISRTPMTDDAFREKMKEAVQQFSEDTTFDADVWNAFAAGLFYVASDIGDPTLYQSLAAQGRRKSKKYTSRPAATSSTTSPRSQANMRAPRKDLGAAGRRAKARMAPPDRREAVRPRPG